MPKQNDTQAIDEYRDDPYPPQKYTEHEHKKNARPYCAIISQGMSDSKETKCQSKMTPTIISDYCADLHLCNE